MTGKLNDFNDDHNIHETKPLYGYKVYIHFLIINLGFIE